MLKSQYRNLPFALDLKNDIQFLLISVQTEGAAYTVLLSFM